MLMHQRQAREMEELHKRQQELREERVADVVEEVEQEGQERLNEINDHYGWDQAERAKKMQVHYAGPTERSKRAKITSLI